MPHKTQALKSKLRPIRKMFAMPPGWYCQGRAPCPIACASCATQGLDLGRDHARHGVDRPARRKGHDQPDRFARINLLRERAGAAQAGCKQGNDDFSSHATHLLWIPTAQLAGLESTAVPIIESRLTNAARLASSIASVPAGRSGMTR